MASSGSSDLKGLFDEFARVGKTPAQLKEKDIRIDSKNIQKMLKQAQVVDSKYTTQLLDNDMARVLGKLTTGGTYVKGIKTFEFNGFKQLINQIAESKKTSADEITSALVASGVPRMENVTGTANKDITGRMTDTTQYTGAHKERFDSDGQGKGKEGRVEEAKNSGYVGNYKGEGTYDKKH